jgi:RimJ/RimL family protein N-acetyltransferase
MEKEDVPSFVEFFSNPSFVGEYEPIEQMSRAAVEKEYDKLSEQRWFVIETKNGDKIGYITHFPVVHPIGKPLEIGFALIPSERGKGYCTEAAKIMTDYLFLSRDIVRIQACTDKRNLAPQRVLEKVGFKKEGIMRKIFFSRGDWMDTILFSILREEWREPKILTKTTS